MKRIFSRLAAAARAPARPAARLAVASMTGLAAGVAVTAPEPAAAYVYKPAKKEVVRVATAGHVAPMKPKVLFVLGGPGAGKGTQCGKLVTDYGYVHLSAGDLLRAEVESGSPDGSMIQRIIDEGKIVPVAVTVNLIKKAMAASGASKFLVDGFPRNWDNLLGWEAIMGEIADVQGVLFYDCPEAVMEARLLERGKTSGRSDDKAEIIRKRFKTYVESTMPVIQHFAAQGKTFHVVADASVASVYAATQRQLAALQKAEVLEATAKLLEAVHAGDWETYERMSCPEMTAIEDESLGTVVRGLAFHRFYFEEAAAAKAAARATGAGAGAAAQSSIINADVKMLTPKLALTTYNRLVQNKEGTSTFAETRVWQFAGGRWQQVHFHRSAAPAPAACKA